MTSLESGALSRRSFMLSSVIATLAGGRYVAEPAGASTASNAASPVLTIEDLVGGEDYVEWRVEPRDAPLAGHLDSIVAGWTPDEGNVSGFVATAAASGPRLVESAVFSTAGTQDAVVDGVDAWIRQDGVAVTRTVRDGSFVRWVAGSGSELEAVRADHLPGDSLAVTTATGDAGAALGPRNAVDRYAEIVRRRASQRAETGGDE